jgi:hypothetical protein
LLFRLSIRPDQQETVLSISDGTQEFASKPFPVPAKRRSVIERSSSDEDNMITVETGRRVYPKNNFFSISTFDESKTDYRKISKGNLAMN